MKTCSSKRLPAGGQEQMTTSGCRFWSAVRASSSRTSSGKSIACDHEWSSVAVMSTPSASEEAAEGAVAGGDLEGAAFADLARQLLDQLARVEAVDPLGLDERHQEALLGEDRPYQPERGARDRLALEPLALEQQLLGEPAVPQVEPDLAPGDPGGGGDADLAQRLGGHGALDLVVSAALGDALDVGLEVVDVAGVDDVGDLALHLLPVLGMGLAHLPERLLRHGGGG